MHDLVLDKPIGACTYQWGEHISTPNIGKQLHFMVFGFWLKQIPIHQLTHNLCFNTPFHLYIHDLVLDEPIGALTSGVNTYVPPTGPEPAILDWYGHAV